MERRRWVALGALLLGVVAIAATAGIYADRTSGGFGSEPPGADDATGAVSQVGLPGWLVENALAVFLTVSALALLVTGALIVWLRGREGLEAIAGLLARTLAIGVLVLLFFVGVRLFLEFVGTRPSSIPDIGGQPPSGGTSGAGGAGGAGASGGSVSAFVITVVALAILGLFAYYAFRRRGGATTAAGAGDTGPAERSERGSNESAIDIDDVPQSNAVYRAWREMAIQAVDAKDRTVTASEVARAAVHAGFDRDAVETLTDLFQEVRYGGRPVTDEREARAQAALRSLDGEVGA